MATVSLSSISIFISLYCIYSFLNFVQAHPRIRPDFTIPDISSNLSFGSSGKQVLYLQCKLYALGLITDEKYITSRYGNVTRDAVKKYQCNKSIVCADSFASYGKAGPYTRLSLNNVPDSINTTTILPTPIPIPTPNPNPSPVPNPIPSPNPNPTTLTPSIRCPVTIPDISSNLSFGSSGKQVLYLQCKLYALGLITEDKYITSRYGNVTKEAVKKYQCNKSIVCADSFTSYGKVGPYTRVSLNKR